MRVRAPQRLLVLLILASHLASFTSLSGVSVLCYGADGHVAIEPACKKPCAPPGNDEHSRPAPGRSVVDAGAASCIDILLMGTSDHAPRPRSSDERIAFAKAVVVALLFTSADVCDLAAGNFLPAPALLPSSDPRAALRTIILRV
jgi:hypothetical protein